MRRRIAALFCAVLLLMQLAAVPATAEDTVYFTAVNETLLELSDATMPFWSGGYLYVSSALFSNKELGVYYSRNTTKQTVVIYTTSHALIFDLAAKTVSDTQGHGYYPPAIERNSTVFIPISMVASYFDLVYTSNKVNHGYLVRVRSSDSTLPDSAIFADAATSQLEARYSQYQKSLSQKNPEQEPQTVPNNDEDDTTQLLGRQTVQFCIKVGAQTSTLLDALDGSEATFFVTEEQIQNSGDLLRRMEATGQSVGLIADASDTKRTIAEQLHDANGALETTTNSKTRLCLVENGTDKARKEAADAGYCCLAADFDRSGYGLNSASNANYLFAKISARGGTVTVWLGDHVSAAGLRSFISAANKSGDRLLGLTETS